MLKTLNDLFILEGMKECQILAGKNGFGRHVQFVNISDAPDIIHYLKKDHLLLTTGYGFKDDTRDLCRLIEQMHDMGCAGVIVKVNRFLKKLPEDLRRLADDLSFPIMDLPTERTLGDLSRHILNYLNDHEAEQLYHALHVQRTFSKMLIQGHNINSLIAQLGHFLDRPVLLLNHRAEKITQSQAFGRDPARSGEAGILMEIERDIPAGRNGRIFTTQSGISVSTYPVQTKRRFPSILVILDADTLPYPTSQMAIEQAGNVISFTIIKEQSIEENFRLLKNNFFADLIEMRLRSKNEIISRADYYGLKSEMDNICAVCTLDPIGDDYDDLQIYEKKAAELHLQIYDRLEDEIVYQNMQATLFTKEKYFVLIIQFPIYKDKEMKEAEAFFEQTKKNISDEHPVSFGISNAVSSLADIPTAYAEAIDAIRNGYERNMTNFLNFYRTREIEELLSTLPRKDLTALYENTLRSLAYPATKEDRELVKTIEVYLNCQCEISTSARKLFVHRNTVKYRIGKSEEILDCSFRDPQDSLRIRVAIVAGKILQEVM